MIELDKTKIYDLLELNNEELQQVLDFIRTEDRDWSEITLESFSNGLENVGLTYGGNEWVWVYDKPTTNAKELFYTLDSIQVDCSELTEGQVKEMCKVYENNGYKQWIDEDALKIENGFTYLRTDWANEFYINGESGTKTIITYEKFMEMFAPKYEDTMKVEQPKGELCDNLKPLINAVEILNELKAYKEKSEEILTLDSIQVDCRNLTEGQIKEMTDIFESKGYCYFENDKEFSLSIIADNSYLHIYEGEIIIDSMVEGLKEITYDKFMELFGEQKVSKPTLSQYFKDLTPIDNPPFIKADSLGYIGQIVDNEEESSAVTPEEIVKYLSKKDIFLTPKQYKKLWKGL